MMLAVPPPPEHSEGLFRGLAPADRLERVMDAAFRQFLHRRDGIALRGIDEVGRTERTSEFFLGRRHIDRDDAACAGDGRAVDGGEPDAATAYDRHSLAGTNLGGMDHRAYACDDRAADQGRAIERHVLADSDTGMLVDEHLLREGGEVQELRQRGAVPGETRRLVLVSLRIWRLAEAEMARQAMLTMAAIGRQARDHMIAGLHRADLRPHGLHDAGALVSQDRRQRVWIGSLDEMQV